MISFVFQPYPTRIIFGAGSLAEAPAEIASLGMKRPLLVATMGRSELAQRLKAEVPGARVFDGAVVHAPAACVEAALAMAAEMDADGLVACGGGSPIGIAKAVAISRPMPMLAIPTTYSGSEMTPAWSITKDGVKSGGKSAAVVARTVIYDSDLTTDLPRGITVTSAINAMAHCAEAFYPEGQSPLITTMAEEGLRRMSRALLRNVDPSGTNGIGRAEKATVRDDLLYGAHLSGLVMAHTGMAFHHKVCHVLGGSFGLPHSESHTVVLPHAIGYTAPAAPEAMARIATAIAAETAPGGLWNLAKRCDAPMTLAALGLDRGDIPEVADKIVAAPYPNPRPMERDAIIGMLHAAYEGSRPQ